MERVRDHERKDHEIRNQRKVREKRPGKTPGKNAREKTPRKYVVDGNSSKTWVGTNLSEGTGWDDR